MRKKMQPKNPMSVVSVNVGLPREVIWRWETISTGIFKQPVQGRVAVRRLNLDGDRQADLTVHGGPDKALRLSSRVLPFLAGGVSRYGASLGNVRGKCHR